MVRDIVLVLEGGCMLGVFGAGVLNAFEKENLHDRIHSIYAVSAGAQNAAYFLAHNTEEASRLYCEYCTEKKIIDFSRKHWYLLDLLRGKRRTNLLNFWHVRKSAKALQDRIRHQEINFYVQVIDVKTGRVGFADGKDIRMVLASSSAAPLYTKAVRVNGRPYIDGLRISKETMAKIAAEHKDKHIIYVLNDSPTYESHSFAYDLLHSLLLYMVFGKQVANANLRTIGAKRRELAALANVHVVANQREVSKFCTEKQPLRDLYAHGIESGTALLKRLHHARITR